MLLMPLHGSVVTEHHLPQRFAQVSQTGDVAVWSDVLVGGKKKSHKADSISCQPFLLSGGISLKHASQTDAWTTEKQTCCVQTWFSTLWLAILSDIAIKYLYLYHLQNLYCVVFTLIHSIVRSILSSNSV